MKSQRTIISTFLSSITYEFIFYTLSALISFVGLAGVASLYLVLNPLTQNEDFVQLVSNFPEVNFLFKNYQNFTFLVVILGLVTYFVSKHVKKHINGEKVALLWQIEKIKSGEFDKKRNLRKNDQNHDVMVALHDLADQLSKKPHG